MTTFEPGQEVRWAGHLGRYWFVGPRRDGRMAIENEYGSLTVAPLADLSAVPVDDGPPRVGDRVRAAGHLTDRQVLSLHGRFAVLSVETGQPICAPLPRLTVVERNPNVTVTVSVPPDEARDFVGGAATIVRWSWPVLPRFRDALAEAMEDRHG